MRRRASSLLPVFATISSKCSCVLVENLVKSSAVVSTVSPKPFKESGMDAPRVSAMMTRRSLVFSASVLVYSDRVPCSEAWSISFWVLASMAKP